MQARVLRGNEEEGLWKPDLKAEREYRKTRGRQQSVAREKKQGDEEPKNPRVQLKADYRALSFFPFQDKTFSINVA